MNRDFGIRTRTIYSDDPHMIAPALNAGMDYVRIRVSVVRFAFDWEEHGGNNKENDGTRYESWSGTPVSQKS
jgi:hypothetical protein